MDNKSNSIIYGFAGTPFGCEGLFAWTAVGVLAIDYTLSHRANEEFAVISRNETFERFQRRYSNIGIPFMRDDTAAENLSKFIFDKGNAKILWGNIGNNRIPIDVRGNSLQKAVWFALAQIPFGSTISYTELASLAGYPKAVRAVATAVGQNPITFLLPCHRVVHRSISGRPISQVNFSKEHFGWGRDMKIRMLMWELSD